MTIKQTALQYNQLGLRVIPVTCPTLPDGKRPFQAWKKYQEQQTVQDIEYLFSDPRAKALAVLTGQGLEVIDVDLKYAINPTEYRTRVLDAIFEAVGLEVYDSLVIAHTVSKGLHIMYRTNVQAGNLKLASRYTLDSEKKNERDTVRVLLETRGVGGYIVAPPSNGYAFDDSNKNFASLPTVTDDQRNAMIAAMRSFEETGEAFTQSKAPIPTKTIGSHKTTIEAFNESHSVSDLLQDAGWQFKYHRAGNDMYVRPGKALREGVGAGVSLDKNLVRIFTTSTEFEADRTYNPFQVFTILNHDGDYSKAAKELYHQGFGDRLSKSKDSFTDKLQALTGQDQNQKEKASNISKMEEICRRRFSIKLVPDAPVYHLWCYDRSSPKLDKHVPIATFGDWVTVVGAAKSRKTTLAYSIAASMMKSEPCPDEDESFTGGVRDTLNFSGNLEGRNMIILDTEQGNQDFFKSMQQFYNQAELGNDDPSNLYAYPLVEDSLEHRLEFVEHILNKVGNVGVLVLDGIVDITEDYNDQKQCRALIDHIKGLTAKHNTMLINILHNARSTGEARGHLGTELINKSKVVIDVSKDTTSNISKCNFKYIRGVQPPREFEFYHDANGNLQIN